MFFRRRGSIVTALSLNLTMTITPNGIWATLDGWIPDHLHEYLLAKFQWVNPLNFNDVIPLYRDDHTMYSGMMRSVEAEILLAGYGCDIELPALTKDFDWNFLYTFRPLQEDAVLAAYNERFGIIKAPPGFGKTICLSALVAMIGQRAIVLTQNEEPFSQAYKHLSEATTIEKVGRIGCGYKEFGDVTVVMVQALLSEFEKEDSVVLDHISKAKVVITDENHHSVSDTYLSIYSILDNPNYIIGFSATPMREDERHELLEAVSGPILHEVTYGDAVVNEILCPVTVYCKEVPRKVYQAVKVIPGQSEWVSRKKNRDKYQMVYDDYIVHNPVRNKMGVEFAKAANAKDRSCALIVGRIEHAEILNEMMPEAVIVTSKTNPKERAQIFEDLKSYKIMTVVTTLLDEAVDIPSLASVALMAGGKSSIKLLQRIRSLRTFEGMTNRGYLKKTRGYVFYPKDNADFLRSHSYKCISLLKGLVKESELNEFKML